MKRRHFVALAGITAIEPPSLAAATLSPTQPSRWQPDGVGALARFGVLTPDFDPVPESEMCAMAPNGVSIHSSRVAWNGDPRAFAEAPYVDNATEQLAPLKPGAIVYAFTSSSYALGAEGDDPLRARLEKRAGGIPVILTCPAAIEALTSLRARRIALIHPPWFSEEMNARGSVYFRNHGLDVVHCARIMPERHFTEVSPAELFDWVSTKVPHQADAVFIGGNGLRAIGTIQALEESLDRPVLTANQVIFWKALRTVGIGSQGAQYGKVLTNTRPGR